MSYASMYGWDTKDQAAVLLVPRSGGCHVSEGRLLGEERGLDQGPEGPQMPLSHGPRD